MEVVNNLSKSNKKERLELDSKDKVIGILKNHLSSSIKLPTDISETVLDSLFSHTF
ncbi:MAG: hypothetical protein WCG25_01205 [bacterium]